MPTQTIDIGVQTPIAAASALKKAGYNVTSAGKPVNVSETDDKEKDLKVKKNITKRTETNEGETILDLFPELNQTEPQDGGEVKDIKLKQKPLEKIKLSKEVTPKKVKRDEMIENVMTKREFTEMVNGSAQPAPAKPSPGTAPTTAPSKPAQRPDKQNPFRPKKGPMPHPKGNLPDWMSSDKLGIGKNQTSSVDEITNMMESVLGRKRKVLEVATEEPKPELINKIKTVRGAIIRLLHLKDLFAKSDKPEEELENILKIIKHYKNR